jgi:transposase-like protein
MEAKLIDYFKTLDERDKKHLIDILQNMVDESDYELLSVNERRLNEKQGRCPHCGSLKYVRNGKKNSVQNYKCKLCNRSFTSYTGTWLAHIHKKEKLLPYLKLMQQGLSLNKIKEQLRISKKTAFDWRHKICASIDKQEKDKLSGITESDETFFLHSEKGEMKLEREARKRGKEVKKKGVSKEHVAVITTTDRKQTMCLQVACFGRISQLDIDESIGDMVNDATILCSDSHRSYQSFAREKKLEHHRVNASQNERVKEGKYHIQNINSIHSRMKKWINSDLYGVATKNLQNYMNWFYIKEKFKQKEFINKIIVHSVVNISGRRSYLTMHEFYKTMVEKSLLN